MEVLSRFEDTGFLGGNMPWVLLDENRNILPLGTFRTEEDAVKKAQTMTSGGDYSAKFYEEITTRPDDFGDSFLFDQLF